MQRLFRLSLLVAVLSFLTIGDALAQRIQLSGRVAPGEVKILLKDYEYQINQDYVIGGTLVIEPGTKVFFSANSRLIDSVGGRIIADGYANATYRSKQGTTHDPATKWEAGQQYADMRYFLEKAGGGVLNTIDVNTYREQTVNPAKYHYIFNVILDTAQRKLVNIVDPAAAGLELYKPVPGNNNQIVITFEEAIMFEAARLAQYQSDVNIKTRPWRRVGETESQTNFVQGAPIQFIGSPVQNFSREWGHIIILPGARAAFFRNVSFEGMKKDITVDKFNAYSETAHSWAADINQKMLGLTNGGGGAITTFSSRTWLVDAKFINNKARLRGGAIQVLQAPAGYPTAFNTLGALKNYTGVYELDKNPAITEKDGSPSKVLSENRVPRIDRIDEDFAEPFEEMGDANYWRQAYDDARLAIYLGRFRNLHFDGNVVQHANVGYTNVGGVNVITDLTDEPADFPQALGNIAYGGAMYIAGTQYDYDRKIEITLGMNNSIFINTPSGTRQQIFFNNPTSPSSRKPDSFIASSNEARNFQQSGSSMGARGGAIYLGANSSLILAGELTGNQTWAKYFMEGDFAGTVSGSYSMGGAVFVENGYSRLSVRGGPDRANRNETYFANNIAGSGGAIYVDGYASHEMSPIIGGSDAFIYTRDYGLGITFEDNRAVSFGGAIFSRRNISIYGAGGVEANTYLGYGGNYPVKFMGNSAGFGGGALNVIIPVAYPNYPVRERASNIVRAVFENNMAGYGLEGNDRLHVVGGGAAYFNNSDLNVVKGVEFTQNKILNGNGAAVALINVGNSSSRFFVSDLDEVIYDPIQTGRAIDYVSRDDVFTYGHADIYADARMLTRFIENEAEVSEDVAEIQNGTGATQVGKGTILTTNDLYDTYWINDNLGWAVGYGGTIIKLEVDKFEDGVPVWNWTYQNAGTTFRLNAVQFVNSTTGFAAGDRGTVVKTVDGGLTWNMLTTPTDKIINDIYFVGTDRGYAVTMDGYVLRTVNGGATWDITRPGTNNLYSVYFTSITKGFAVGQFGSVLVTTNGGDTWDFQQIVGLSADLNDVFFRSTNVGFVVGNNGTVVWTQDGGNTWDFAPFQASADLASVYFAGQNNGYITGSFGTFYKTVDGGTTWEKKELGTTWNFYGSYFPSVNVGYLVGDRGSVWMTRDAGDSWLQARPKNEGFEDITRFHYNSVLPENGIGLGGAMYILDSTNVDEVQSTYNPFGRQDPLYFNRVRMQNNVAFTGSAVYSDNYDLKLVFNRSLINSNVATSEIGTMQNAITGPVKQEADFTVNGNYASSDLASATIYGEIQGPLPSSISSEAANSIYDNHARFLIRLPDGPNTKGILAGSNFGFGGTDTLRGNYWGQTQANVNIVLPERGDLIGQPSVVRETFFVAGDGETHLWLSYEESRKPIDTRNAKMQGPFELVSNESALFNNYVYKPVIHTNVDDDENTPHANSIPEALLMEGHIYDIYDKGTDIKSADYSNRRMSPIEDFAVGIPPFIKIYDNMNQPSYGKYLKRWTRNPNKTDEYESLAALQTEYMPDATGQYYHPVGYPVYLEAEAIYDGDPSLPTDVNYTNHDRRFLNQSVFFAINETTGDFIRLNFSQVSEDAPNWMKFRSTLNLVPDMTNRNPNTTIRRTFEGLANFGSGVTLFRALERDAYNEDMAALGGRRYTANYRNFANEPNLFMNNYPNIEMPEDNKELPNQWATFYAGEKYDALPVNVGDAVRIVSRTVLWRDGADEAYDRGISFRITNSTLPPVFTGNVVTLQTDTIVKIVPSEFPGKDRDTLVITEFLNKVFVTEDRTYPWAPEYSEVRYSQLPLYGSEDPLEYDVEGGRGRDSILNVTSIDTNLFYNPVWARNYQDADALDYSWTISSNTGASRWLIPTIVKQPQGQKYYSAHERVEFRGRPINPFVVPGGEKVKVSVANYPPNWRSIEELRRIGVPQEELDNFIATYPSYYNAESREVYANADLMARYVQQDTVNVGLRYSNDYEFDIFVVNMPPRFFDFVYRGDQNAIESATDRIYRQDDANELYVEYSPSISECNIKVVGTGANRREYLVANLTDKLRFQVDINTTDELEDKSPAADGWHFNYGRTAYGFYNVAVNGDDIIITDTVFYDADPFGPDDEYLVQVRPNWMSNEYLYAYDSETDQDVEAVDFTLHGKLNYRIPKETAEALLLPNPQYNNYMNTDTVFAVVVNDGHGIIAQRQLRIFVNVAPEILNPGATLPVAVEGQEYNPALMDANKKINVFDVNFNQRHTYELIYADDARNTIPKDPCFPEAGSWSLSGLKTTPNWLQINPENGLLFGIPGVTDAPKTSTVTVLVTDEDGLTAVETFTIEVERVNHNPILTGIPVQDCVDEGQAYRFEVTLKDLDLLRNAQGAQERITIRLEDGNGSPLTGWTISPATIDGPLNDEEVLIVISTNNFNVQTIDGRRAIINVIAEDNQGNSYTLEIVLFRAAPTNFIAEVIVTNSVGSSQGLQFGVSSEAQTSTGDGSDNFPEGRLDEAHCEFELPPMPPNDVFDARWSISRREGIKRNIYPEALPNSNRNHMYIGRFNVGGADGSSSAYYPVTLKWRPADIPARDDAQKNPQGSSFYIRDYYSNGQFFTVNMRNPEPNLIADGGSIRVNWDNANEYYVITINNPSIDGFVIFHDWGTSVEDNDGLVTGLRNVSPNPINDNTSIAFDLGKTTHVKLEVVDNLGNVVARLMSENASQGTYNVNWSGLDETGMPLASGAYTVRLIAGDEVFTQSVVIVK